MLKTEKYQIFAEIIRLFLKQQRSWWLETILKEVDQIVVHIHSPLFGYLATVASQPYINILDIFQQMSRSIF